MTVLMARSKMRQQLVFVASVIVLLSSTAYGSPELLDKAEYNRNLERWLQFPEEERQALRIRVKQLSPGRIRELKRKHKEFNAMPRELQDRIRANYRDFRELSKEQKFALQEHYRIFKNLPEEKQMEIIALARAHRKSKEEELKNLAPSQPDENLENKNVEHAPQKQTAETPAPVTETRNMDVTLDDLPPLEINEDPSAGSEEDIRVFPKKERPLRSEREPGSVRRRIGPGPRGVYRQGGAKMRPLARDNISTNRSVIR
jgi:hypothetical protein